MSYNNKSVVNEGRAYSTDFINHKRLIHQLARKCYGRLMDARTQSVDYDDVFQEMCVSFTKASKTYDPSLGITFTAYFGRAAFNHFNRLADKVIKEQITLNVVGFEELEREDGDDFLSRYVSQNALSETAEAKALISDDARENISRLSSMAKLIVGELLSPSAGVTSTYEKLKSAKEAGRANGEMTRCPKGIDIGVIAKHHNLSKIDMVKIKGEFKRKLGVMIA